MKIYLIALLLAACSWTPAAAQSVKTFNLTDPASLRRLGRRHPLLGNPAIVVADNGPGFVDPPEYLVEPFVTRKPEGMGLGLHIASEVMKAQGGELLFPDADDIDLPRGFGGAIVALSFGKTKE